MDAANSRPGDYPLARLHAVILLVSWVAGTALAMAAYALAPTTPPVPVTAEYLALLRAGWGWYAAGYALFFVADCAIALLGASLVAWLRPQPGLRGPAIVLLFAVSGMLGVLADVRMLGAAQLLRVGSPLLAPDVAAAWLDDLNATCNWLSVASFLPAGIATWLACAVAVQAGVGAGWIAFNRFAALYQVAAGLLSAGALLTRQAGLTDLALIVGVVGMPALAVAWLGWMLREMRQPARSRRP